MTHAKEQPMVTVREFAAMEGLDMTEEELARMDRAMEAHCVREGLPIGKRYTFSDLGLTELTTESHRAGYAQALQELGAFLADLRQELVSGSVRGTPVEVADGLLLYVTMHLEAL